ncbi:homoserine dehydrogenase [Atopobacter sp. AH10]|uniref:homoserine dehydrogenase n=1 Tax=Atopobacter sp. AH10 TaxID=2315861 RepID=UPI000EF1FCF6|nr:homoserine dehydrogenase [Atopobacter sp. AH10]RLK62704.1 homoserine dehydrogenase [Atopobacter sp. AH10]
MIHLALLGFGTVNAAVYTILEERHEEFVQAFKDEFVVKKILVRRQEAHPEVKELLTTDIKEITEDPEIDVLIEATGAVDEIYEDIKEALKSKHVITANKALVSKYYEELVAFAEKSGKSLQFEAAVAGAVPVINQLKKIATVNAIEEVVGVLNGSCNFILSQMEEGKTFDEALKEAQALGFAEADPSADVDGLDTQRKLRLLATILFNKAIKEEDIEVEGIRQVTAKDIEQAKKEGQRYKLVARATSQGSYSVSPERVDKNSDLGLLINGENAVIVKTSNAKDLIFKGPGAGGRPTASAILLDLLRLFDK